MRSREFIMKDAYSFDKDDSGLDESYKKMFNAYEKIFKRCGLDCRPVEADSGAIGGSNSHEFTAISEVGESEIAFCESCDMAATLERAATVDAKPTGSENDFLLLEDVHTPDSKTIEEVAKYLGITEDKTMKALLFVTYDEEGNKDKYVAAFVRGDRELNMTKLINALNIPEHAIEFADEKEMSAETGCVGGFTGPIGLHDCIVVVDSELPGQVNLVAGANKPNYHTKNVNYGRDYKADILVDLKTLREGDPCPVCGKPVKTARGIEVGQVFKLGTKYSEAMGAYYKDENQKEKPIVMGCYGIGVTRTLAAVVEQHHDENGIIWPISVAPYHCIITLINPKDDVQSELAESIYTSLQGMGVEVLLDDRAERPGVKFKDADLLGIPIRITVGKLAGEGQVEYKLRRDEDKTVLSAEQAVAAASQIVSEEADGRIYLK